MRLLRRPEVERLTGLHRATIYKLVQRGEFPKPVQISGRAVAWPELAVRQWIRERMRKAGYSEDDVRLV